jgi:5-methyltetrahydropteroyltriglutamate--homocysteine methyltransferase
MMTLKTSTTGSWPPTYDPDKPVRHLPIEEQDPIVHESIERAIRDQIDLGIDILVDGQVRDDIISLFASKLPGYAGSTLPYRAVGPVRPADESITGSDYLYARSLASDRPLKAHITGPMTLSRATLGEAGSGYVRRNDPKLVRDLAQALGQEAHFLVQAGAEIVQIDEPALADGVDLDLAFEAMEQIVETGEIPFPALHICKNVTRILDDVLTRSPVKMVSMEGSWLKYDELTHINRDYLSRCGKQIGLGCIQVRDYKLERLTTVQNFLDQMVVRLGEENIWAAMPNCGLRPVPYEVALNKLKIMVTAARSL